MKLTKKNILTELPTQFEFKNKSYEIGVSKKIEKTGKKITEKTKP